MRPVVIVGAGAAGLFCAAQLRCAGRPAVLVEHMPRPAQKLAITGKGRCNLTNNCEEDVFLQNVRHNPHFLHSAIHAFPPCSTMQWFEERGVPLKTERGRRVFPRSDRAADIVQALLCAAKGTTLLRGRAVELLMRGGRAAGVRLEGGGEAEGRAVLVATGGLSYPATGSTGLGYQLARQAGHAVAPPLPSLVAMVEDGDTARQMAGLSLRNVRLSLWQDDREMFCEQGELLFTHFGLSGPLALSASAYLGDFARHSYTVSLDLKPALSPEALDTRLQRDFAAVAARQVEHSLDKLLPKRMRGVMLRRWGVPEKTPVAQITRAQRQALGALVKRFAIPIKQRGDLAHAVITSGGVDVKEVNPKTMESRLLPGLYFAGEVLDVDGYTGGYNLQIAFCTAYAAAAALAQEGRAPEERLP